MSFGTNYPVNQKTKPISFLRYPWFLLTDFNNFFAIPTRNPVSEMTYTVSSGTLNSSIPYHPIRNDHRIYLVYNLQPQLNCVANLPHYLTK